MNRTYCINGIFTSIHVHYRPLTSDKLQDVETKFFALKKTQRICVAEKCVFRWRDCWVFTQEEMAHWCGICTASKKYLMRKWDILNARPPSNGLLGWVICFSKVCFIYLCFVFSKGEMVIFHRQLFFFSSKCNGKWEDDWNLMYYFFNNWNCARQ